MPAVFATIDRLSLFAAVSLFALPALAAEEHPMLPPDLPEVAVVVDVVSPTRAEPAQVEPDVAAPELPSVIVSVPPADPGPPELPEAKVAITQADIFPTALAGRLTAGEEIARLPRKQREALASFYAGRLDRPLWVEGERFHADGDSRDDAAQGRRRGRARPGRLRAPGRCRARQGSRRRLGRGRTEAQRRGDRLCPRRPRRPHRAFPHLRPRHAEASSCRKRTRFWRHLPRHPDAGAALAAYNPPHAGYRALKARLAELRASRPARPMVRVPPGPRAARRHARPARAADPRPLRPRSRARATGHL